MMTVWVRLSSGFGDLHPRLWLFWNYFPGHSELVLQDEILFLRERLQLDSSYLDEISADAHVHTSFPTQNRLRISHIWSESCTNHVYLDWNNQAHFPYCKSSPVPRHVWRSSCLSFNLQFCRTLELKRCSGTGETLKDLLNIRKNKASIFWEELLKCRFAKNESSVRATRLFRDGFRR